MQTYIKITTFYDNLPTNMSLRARIMSHNCGWNILNRMGYSGTSSL